MVQPVTAGAMSSGSLRGRGATRALLERIDRVHEDVSICVLRIKARGHRELVTVIGHAAVISAGEWVTATGDWINDRTHGQQYKARGWTVGVQGPL
jgi:exodeoxyribonuclease V alpha subunit